MHCQMTIILLFWSFFLNVFGETLFENSPCANSGVPGTCVIVPNCPEAIQQLINTGAHNFLRCNFKGIYEIVCCPNQITTTTPPTTTPPPPTLPLVAVIKGVTVPGKSETACQRYSSQFSIPFVFTIIDGEDASPGEFPHMVALGLYNAAEDIYTLSCGGTIISEEYVLTAAHCINNQLNLKLAFVRPGVLKIPTSVQKPDPLIDVKVVKVIVHPRHNRRKRYNDIALAKLERRLTWSVFIRPACLHSKDDTPSPLFITGWGRLASGLQSETLQKAVVGSTTQDYCNQIYNKKFVIANTQICAADNRSDACQGDSGGPLQVFEKDKNIFTIVGITSFGMHCATRYPGVYTRVSSYIPWIEGIVDF